MKKNKVTATLFLLSACLFSLNTHSQNTDPNISKKEIAEVVAAVSNQLNENYIFPETAEKMASTLKKNLKKGNYKNINNAQEFSQALTKDLVSVSKDKHIRVRFDPERIADQQQATTPEDQKKLADENIAYQRSSNFGFNEVKILEGNIGYLDLRSFQDPSYAGDTAVAAMNFLSNSDAVIIDLRQNGGGSPQMIQLISSFLFAAEPVHLNNFYWRPTDSHSQTWTLPYVNGKRFPDAPVYVLTSKRTFSAAEEFSYNLKNLKRATLVGETTGGGAHPGGTQIATDRFAVWVPSGRAINPITSTNWEGTGVSPHIEVKQDLAFNTAYLDALKSLTKDNSNKGAQFTYQWIMEGLKAEETPTTLSETEMLKYTGNYGPRSVTFENNRLYYQRGEGNKYQLMPMGMHRFKINEVPDFRIQFEFNDGESAALIGQYDNDSSDRNKKD